jgi:transcriptional regulator with XRE-family HTH domain
MDKFGDKLRAARKDRGLTLEQLAVLCNTSETVLRNYEKARKSPNVEMLLRICEALKVSPDYLLQDELSFAPYNNKESILKIINELTPSQSNMLNDFLASLQKNASM